MLGILIPAIIFTALCLTVWSRPEAWWDWLLCVLPLILWFMMPVMFAMVLFKDKKTNEYFTKSAV